MQRLDAKVGEGAGAAALREQEERLHVHARRRRRAARRWAPAHVEECGAQWGVGRRRAGLGRARAVGRLSAAVGAGSRERYPALP